VFDPLLCSHRAEGGSSVSVAGSVFKGRAFIDRCHEARPKGYLEPERKLRRGVISLKRLKDCWT
jgi:hypothetical protein